MPREMLAIQVPVTVLAQFHPAGVDELA